MSKLKEKEKKKDKSEKSGSEKRKSEAGPRKDESAKVSSCCLHGLDLHCWGFIFLDNVSPHLTEII